MKATRDIEHGTRKGYRELACRCDECRQWNRDTQRAYVANVLDRDGVTPTQKYRPGQNRRARGVCSDCGKVLSGTTSERPLCKSCRYRTKRGIYLAKPDRLAIYQRDNWVCGICQERVDPSAKGAWSATIDHIVPRIAGGTDEHSNLRLAHHWCNSARGDGTNYSDDDFRG